MNLRTNVSVSIKLVVTYRRHAQSSLYRLLIETNVPQNISIRRYICLDPGHPRKRTTGTIS